MKYLLIMFSLIPVLARADVATDVEVTCWNRGSAADGSLLCEYVVVMGKLGADRIFPELAAPDSGGPKTLEQAASACQAMGYPFVIDFSIETPSREVLMILLTADGAGMLKKSNGSFIQHLQCADI